MREIEAAPFLHPGGDLQAGRQWPAGWGDAPNSMEVFVQRGMTLTGVSVHGARHRSEMWRPALSPSPRAIPLTTFANVGVSGGHWYELCAAASAEDPLERGSAVCRVGVPNEHAFGAAENTRWEADIFGNRCYTACGIPEGDTDAMRSRGDAICMEAAARSGWACGYAGDICTRPSLNPFSGPGEVCQVECEFGDSFQCGIAAAKRDANLEQLGCRCCASAFLNWSIELSLAFPSAYGHLLYAYCKPGTGSSSGCTCYSQYSLGPVYEIPCERAEDPVSMFSNPWCR